MPALPYFFPTRVVLIDDEPQVLRTSALLFGRRPEVSEVLSFPGAVEAEAHFARHTDPEGALDAFAAARCHDELDEVAGGAPRVLRTVEIDVSARPAAMAAAGRELVSVIVCDFAMPQIDGLQFFARHRDAAVRRVLLTALCDEQRAVRAFNQGLIHQFVHKADAAGPRGLERVLTDQMEQFFRFRTAHLAAALVLGPGGQFLSQPDVPRLLQRVMREWGFREYFFSVNPTGFLLRRQAGQQAPANERLLVLADAHEFERVARVVHEIEGPAALGRALLARELMPVGRDGMPIYEAGERWAQQAVVPQVQDGSEPLFWDLLQVPEVVGVERVVQGAGPGKDGTRPA